MTDRWHEISTRAFTEARAGAPAGMVAFYVTVETEHVRQGHGGNAQDCDPCNDFALEFRRTFDAARESA